MNLGPEIANIRVAKERPIMAQKARKMPLESVKIQNVDRQTDKINVLEI